MAKPVYFYGIHAVQALLKERPEDALELFVVKARDDKRIGSIITLAEQFGVSLQLASKEKLEALAGSTQHQGAVLLARPHPIGSDADFALLLNQQKNMGRHALFVVLDQVTDPHNLGAIIRTAAAMGATALVTSKDKSAGLTGVSVKVAAGGAEYLPVICVTNLARGLNQLKDLGVLVVGTALDKSAKPLSEIDTCQPIALVMGAEDTGLRRLTKDTCDAVAYLPLSGQVQSLNVSVAAGMAIYEVMRQRGQV